MLQTADRSRNIKTTCVMINYESGSENKIIDEIQSISGVKECMRTIGPYDILTIIESDAGIIEGNYRKQDTNDPTNSFNHYACNIINNLVRSFPGFNPKLLV